jgi:hypothetical protein
MSEISSLKATLSGKEAEVASLKTAVGDAERRVGEAWEEVRNEVARKEELRSSRPNGIVAARKWKPSFCLYDPN